jgi:hypothetical protein
VQLLDGRECMTLDVAWGDEFRYELDFCHANDIATIEDLETAAVLFDLSGE